jgi:non-ribosomal peptide synthetase component F
MPGVTLSTMATRTGTAKFDLTLFIVEEENRLAAAWEYNTDLFQAETIRRMHRHFEMVLEGVVSDPDRRIPRLRLLTDEERDRVTIEWNETVAAYPDDCCLHHLIEARAAESPAAVAVVSADREVTFEALNERGNRVAERLRDLGVGPDTLVGLCVERSVEMVVGLLGVLKAGGAYVPLDATYPQERLRYMIEDSGLAVLLTQERMRGRLPECAVEVVCLDDNGTARAPEAAERVGTRRGPRASRRG